MARFAVSLGFYSTMTDGQYRRFSKLEIVEAVSIGEALGNMLITHWDGKSYLETYKAVKIEEEAKEQTL